MKNLTEKEISCYAPQMQDYDMDGYVGMVVSDSGILRKRKSLFLYYLKLKGNMLFYFKVTEKEDVLESQLEGCQIIEACIPRMDDGLNDEYKYRITLIYPRLMEDKSVFTFYIRDRAEATAWEQAINKGRYEFLRKRFSDLRNQLQELTGDDPVEGTYFACKPVLDPGLEVARKPVTSQKRPELPYLELSIACSSLVSVSPDCIPSPMIKVSLFDESNGKWIKFCKTETVENCADPQFTQTISLTEEQANTHSRARFEVYDVRNKKEGIVSRIGNSDCKLSLLKKSDGLNTLEIKGADEEENLKGFIYIQTFNSAGDSSRAQLVAKRLTQFIQSSDEHSKRSEDMLTFSKEVQDHSLMNNSITSSYRLPQNDSDQVLRVTEIMSESQQVWDITIGMIQVCMVEETERLYELEELSGLNQRWQDRMQDLLEEKKSFVNHYRSCIDHLSKHLAKKLTFKRSIDKKETWLECMPTNLHIQTMKVIAGATAANTSKLTSQYDLITVGCSTAYSLKYKSGGLKKMLQTDICFIQAAATLAVSFTIHLKNNILDWSFMAQLHNIGFLAHWESLISTNGEENSMLEDIEVTLFDINNSLYFQLISQSDELFDDKPIIKGSRSRMIVQVPVSQYLFQLLPYPLQTGQLIKVIWIFFNVGINEQQTLADRIGHSTVQDRINQHSLNDLHKYFVKYSELFLFATEELGKSVEDTRNMLERLHELIAQHKQKHVEILQLSALLCRKMNGSRITSCKSGKDRTSMSCTLEQCRILTLNHNLRDNMFYHTLDAMRLTGTRIYNAEKNIGEKCYAFNKLQRFMMPFDYRAPDGSYKKLQS